MPKILSKNVKSCNSSIIGPSKELPTADLPTLREILSYCGLLKPLVGLPYVLFFQKNEWSSEDTQK